MKITQLLDTVSRNENSAFFYTPSFYEGEKCYLFTSPVKVLTVRNREEYDAVFLEVESLRKTHVIAAMLNYEAGYLFEEKFNVLLQSGADEDLITLLCYEKANCIEYDNSEIVFPDYDDLIETESYEIKNARFNISYEEYISALAKIKKYIYDGDTYQVNYTLKNKYDFTGNINRLFLDLITNQSTKYSALINHAEKFIVSISPELFFEMDDDMVITRPMKGTIERGLNLADDERLKNQLIHSEKDKAENVMIVDLLRNDFGRIAEFGSVKADPLLDIEKYESVFQMTSTISAKLRSLGLGKILENVFPCGSITGAPKIRTMEIISELEMEPRGIYTGSIGIIYENSAKFNVAIRTLVIDKKSGKGEIGLGGGIVWDSIPEKEYNEILVKGLFLSRQDKPFQIIETLLLDNGNYFLLEEHLERLKSTAGFFLFTCREEKIIKELEDLKNILSPREKYKIRLLLFKEGTVKISADLLEESPGKTKVCISGQRINTNDKFRYFKTTNRDLYDSEYKSAAGDGYFDVLFLNENDDLAEGAITNIFLLINGKWNTPDITSGILAGCYRGYFKKSHNALEKKLKLKDLTGAEEIILVNSVRKEVRVEEIWKNDTIIWKQNR